MKKKLERVLAIVLLTAVFFTNIGVKSVEAAINVAEQSLHLTALHGDTPVAISDNEFNITNVNISHDSLSFNIRGDLLSMLYLVDVEEIEDFARIAVLYTDENFSFRDKNISIVGFDFLVDIFTFSVNVHVYFEPIDMENVIGITVNDWWSWVEWGRYEVLVEAWATLQFSPWGGIMPEFDNIYDMLYYLAFGELFDIIQEHSIALDISETYDDLILNIISTVTLLEDIGGWQNLRSYTFFSLQDQNLNRNIFNEEIEFGSASVLLYVDDDINIFRQQHATAARRFHFDRESRIAYFMIEEWHDIDQARQMPTDITLNFSFESLHTNFIFENIILYVDLKAILENHQAEFSFEQEFWGSTSFGTIDELSDFRDTTEAAEALGTLVKGDLDIPIYEYMEGAYITNIAHVDGFLHLQIGRPIANASNWSPLRSWESLQIIYADPDIWDWPMLYAIVLAMEWDEYFVPIYDREYEELVASVENVEDVVLNVNRSFYQDIIDLGFNIEVTSPVMKFEPIYFNNIDVEILGEIFTISNLRVDFRNISLEIEDDKRIDELIGFTDGRHHVSIWDLFDEYMVLIFEDGTEQTYYWHGASHGIVMLEWLVDSYEQVFRAGFSGGFIDTENLVAIKINRVIATVK